MFPEVLFTHGGQTYPRWHRQLIDIDVIKGRVIVRCRASFQELRLHLRVRDRHDRHRAVFMEVLVMYLTVQQLRVEVEILAVDMSEDSDVFRASLYRKGNRKRITVSPRKAPRLQSRLGAKASKKLFSEMKSKDVPFFSTAFFLFPYNYFVRVVVGVGTSRP